MQKDFCKMALNGSKRLLLYFFLDRITSKIQAVIRNMYLNRENYFAITGMALWNCFILSLLDSLF